MHLTVDRSTHPEYIPGVTTTTTTPATFTTGQVVTATSACDSDCVWTFEVVARTAKFVTLRDVDNGDTMRVGVRCHDGEEWASPFGTFSMAPVVRAGAR